MLLFLFSCLLSGEPEVPSTYSAEWVEVGFKKPPSKIIDSSVKIAMFSNGKEIGHGSGNYFAHAGRDFILTAAHVVNSKVTMKVTDGKKLVDMRVIYIDFINDIAIIVPEEPLETIVPMHWVLNKSKDLSGNKVYHSGFPSHYGKLLIKGMVSADNGDGIILQSFALPGSSGSVVFDKHGRVIGVLSAVGLHMSQFSPYPSIQEDVVFISSVQHLNTKKIMEVLKCGE